jgi:polysaccharide export outer membrane protein
MRRFAVFGRFVVVLLVGAGLGGCAQPTAEYAYVAPAQVGGPYVPPTVLAAPASFAPAQPAGLPIEPYLLDSGDRLRVQVFGQDGLSNSYVVDAAGNVSISLIGPVAARGMTTSQLGNAIAARLRQGYIRDPRVSVEVEAYRPFFILGEVNAPGQYPFVANMTAESAVAIAGGYSPRANKRYVVITRNINGQMLREEMPLNYPIRPGDTVTINERWF